MTKKALPERFIFQLSGLWKTTMEQKVGLPKGGAQGAYQLTDAGLHWQASAAARLGDLIGKAAVDLLFCQGLADFGVREVAVSAHRRGQGQVGIPSSPSTQLSTESGVEPGEVSVLGRPMDLPRQVARMGGLGVLAGLVQRREASEILFMVARGEPSSTVTVPINTEQGGWQDAAARSLAVAISGLANEPGTVLVNDRGVVTAHQVSPMILGTTLSGVSEIANQVTVAPSLEAALQTPGLGRTNILNVSSITL
jgi:hypothetical protein